MAFGGDYSTSRGSSSFTVVKPGLNGESSVTGFDTGGDGTMTDSRDGLEYYVTTIGNTQWMRQNLAWDGTGGEEDKTVGRAYEDCDVASTIFGRYYTWDEAQSACPPGWRLPKDTDWAALAEKYGETHEPGTDYEGLAGDLLEQTLAFNGTKMWEYWKDVDMTNASRLSVMPVGFANVDDAEYDFDFLYTYAAFWTGDEYRWRSGRRPLCNSRLRFGLLGRDAQGRSGVFRQVRPRSIAREIISRDFTRARASMSGQALEHFRTAAGGFGGDGRDRTHYEHFRQRKRDQVGNQEICGETAEMPPRERCGEELAGD